MIQALTQGTCTCTVSSMRLKLNWITQVCMQHDCCAVYNRGHNSFAKAVSKPFQLISVVQREDLQ